MVYSALDIAKWFLAYNRQMMIEKEASSITNLKLQKLLYYAFGVYYALTGKKLFNDPILAWKHGPVVRSVYDEYRKYEANGIDFEGEEGMPEYTEEVNAILKEVYEEFGQYSAWKLRNMTHEERPWKETPQNGEISPELIKEFFEEEYIA